MNALEALQCFTLAISPSHELEQLLPCILQSAVELGRAHAGALFLTRHAGDSLEISATYNLDHNAAALVVNPDCRKSLQTRRPSASLGPGARPAVFAPLHLADDDAGMVYLERSPNSHPFGSEDLRVLEIAMTQAAFAIQNTRLAAGLERANDARAEFVSKITHELRVPMTSLKGYTHLIRQGAAGPVTEQQANFLHVISNNVDRMSDLVTNLADIALLEAGRLPLKTARFPLQSAVDSALEGLLPAMQQKKQALEVRLPAGDLQAYADPERATQVLAILLGNASRYTPEAGKVSLHAQAAGPSIRVEVADTGIGIAAPDLEQLFQPFFRSEDPQVREYPGWGLELYLARLLLETMGGKIGASSQTGQGSVFWFTLPAPPA